MDSGPEANSERGERSFAQPPLVRTLALWGAVVSVLAAATVIVSRVEGWWEDDLLQLASLLVCALSVYLSLQMLKGSRDTFVTTEEGLWQHSPGKPSVFLAWKDVGDVYPENVMQRLVVADRSGARRLAIEFHLQEFGELRRIIFERTRAAG